MWSEEWDKKFREAAGQDPHPADAEKGWHQMEPLLEKHLPQDRRRKRFFFLIFLLAGIGAAVYFNLQTNPQTAQQPGANTNNTTAPNQSASTRHTPASDGTRTIPPPATDTITKAEQLVAKNNTSAPFSINSKSDQPRKNQSLQTLSVKPGPSLTRKTRLNPQPVQQLDDLAEPIQNISTVNATPTRSNAGDPLPTDSFRSNAITPIATDVVTRNHDSSNVTANPEPHDVAKTENDSTTHPPITKKAGKLSRWGISLMTSADISGVSPSKMGSWQAAYGIGVSYSINDRLTIRTGIMRSRKIYNAGSNDYNPPKIFWNYVSELEKVMANCLVYEIPLNVQYFFPGNKGNWFASGGLHSMLMKNEDYHYDYKDLSGQDRYMALSYKNYSNHFLSLINLSGGYRFNINKKLRLSFEPYFQIPIGGVGYGKVKLYSTGMLFSATILP